jgi:diguanylate cyclase (GGDEF)-like protein
LVVDDEQPSRAALRVAVETLGHRCRLAASGFEALSLHRTKPADVIVSDWRMAGMDGMELCRRVRAMDGAGYSYLLFASGHANKRDFVDAVRAGADGCLAKPIDLDDLEARLIAAGRVVTAYRALAERNIGLRHDSEASFRAARVDALTGAGNRLRLDEDLELLEAHVRKPDRREGADANTDVSRYARRVSIAMCDLDDFKHYNDYYGHLAGDSALHQVTQAVRKSLRRTDQVYRYGGDEFLVVLSEQSSEDAAAALDRVRAAVEGLGIKHAPGAKHPRVTVSIGVAPVHSPAEPSHPEVGRRRIHLEAEGAVRAAIERADSALYRAKRRGGNALVVDEPAP